MDLGTLKSSTDSPGDSAAESTLVCDLIRRQAQLSPQSTAILCGSTSLTYAQLEPMANRLANRLRQLGVGPESFVGVCLRRDVHLIPALLAVLKAGGAYVPLDPQYPSDRVQIVMEDARCSVILSSRDVLSRLPPHGARVFCIDDDHWSGLPVTAPSTRLYPENLAYVIYTSGSTGRPKGVAITHRSLSAFVDWSHEEYSPADLAIVAACASTCFDASIFEIFVTLARGGTVLLLEDSLSFARDEREYDPTLVCMVPSAMKELLRIRCVPKSVRVVNLGGETVSAALASSLYALGHVDRVYNCYGPTEDTTYSTVCLVPREVNGDPTIGKSMSRSSAYVLGPDFERLPPGVDGDLYLAGDGLARGYLHRPSLTAERFLPDPFSSKPGARMYKTGDRAEWQAGGDLVFRGRADRQIKLRGYRIELPEIEAYISALPGVHDVVVLARAISEDVRLVAYVVADGDVTERHVTRSLQGRLPGYMVPSAIMLMDRMPLMPNGKVDHRSLPVPAVVSSGAYEGPRNSTDATLALLWAQLLGVEQIGIHDNFFELGGRSLLAVQLVARIRETLNAAISLPALFKAPTIAQLTDAIADGRATAEAWDCVAPLRRSVKGRNLFLFPPASGQVFGYLTLAHFVKTDFSIFAFRSPEFRPGADLMSLRETVEIYVRRLREIQGRGPYLLGGWSYGSILAYEAARHLLRLGESVSALLLLEPGRGSFWSAAVLRALGGAASWCALHAPSLLGIMPGVRNSTTGSNKLRRLMTGLPTRILARAEVEKLVKFVLPDGDRPALSSLMVMSEAELYDTLVEGLKRNAPPEELRRYFLPGVSSTELVKAARIWKHHELSALGYRPRGEPLGVPIHAFVGEDNHEVDAWRERTSRSMIVHRYPSRPVGVFSSHESFLEPANLRLYESDLLAAMGETTREAASKTTAPS